MLFSASTEPGTGKGAPKSSENADETMDIDDDNYASDTDPRSEEGEK